MTRTSSFADKARELKEAFRELDIARERLARAISDLNVPRSPSPSPSPRHRIQNSPSPERNPPLLDTSNLRLGDRVQIKFPNPGQQNTGIVVGATRGGFLSVRTPNGDVIRRMPHNLRFLS